MHALGLMWDYARTEVEHSLGLVSVAHRLGVGGRVFLLAVHDLL